MIGRRRTGIAQQLAVILIVLFLTLFVGNVEASDESIGTYGAPFLHVPIGATLMSVPDIVAGMDPDASLLFSNPAALSGVSRGELFLSRANWLDDLSLNAASLVMPSQRYDLRWSLGTRLLFSGDLKGYDDAGEVVDEQSYYGLALTGGLSKRIQPLGLSLGISVTYLREHLPLETGDGFTMTLGASYERGANRFDAFAANLGGKVAFEGREYPVDSYYVFGYGRAINQGWGGLNLGGQFMVSRSEVKRVQLGAAYYFHKYFSLRTGIDHAFDAPDAASAPISGGLGFEYGNFSLDYGYTPHEYFSNTHTFSVGFRFNGGTTSSTTYGGVTEPVRTGANVPSVTHSEGPAGRPTATVQKTADAAYEIVAGTHSRLESAEAEVKALHLLKVSAVVENQGDRYRVLIGTYSTAEQAKSALERYEKQGHQFRIAQNGD